jgi:hypothetical protein
MSSISQLRPLKKQEFFTNPIDSRSKFQQIKSQTNHIKK